MNINPTNREGVITWVMTGFFAGILALLIGFFIPAIVPASAKSQKIG